jgi:hypothetical protein
MALKRQTGVIPDKLKQFRSGNYKYYIVINCHDKSSLFKVTKSEVFKELKLLPNESYQVSNLQRYVMINFFVKNPCIKE